MARSGVYAARLSSYTATAVIYCVIPPELEGELFATLTSYYADNPDVTVIIDRRRSGGVRELPPATPEARAARERRRRRVPGTFPAIDAH
jgi:hypothetical protein